MINLCVNEDKKFQTSVINDYIRCTIAIGAIYSHLTCTMLRNFTLNKSQKLMLEVIKIKRYFFSIVQRCFDFTPI